MRREGWETERQNGQDGVRSRAETSNKRNPDSGRVEGTRGGMRDKRRREEGRGGTDRGMGGRVEW